MTLLDRTIVRLLPAVPKPVVQRLSSRYIAGSTLEDALRVVRRLNGEGKPAWILTNAASSWASTEREPGRGSAPAPWIWGSAGVTGAGASAVPWSLR